MVLLFSKLILFLGHSARKSSGSYDSQYSSRSNNNNSPLHLNSNTEVLDATDLSRSRSLSHTNQQTNNNSLNIHNSKKKSVEETNRKPSRDVSSGRVETPRSGRFSNVIPSINVAKTSQEHPKTPQLSKSTKSAICFELTRRILLKNLSTL